MKSLTTEEVKQKFLQHFRENNHQIIPGSSILPVNDPTLMFINSGMAPLKKFFLQEATPPSNRLSNYQDCIRLIDIEDIGDSYHGTSFRMMGSWSFGDYFKEGSIELAIKLITEGFGFPIERLYATVFVNDGSIPGVPDDTESARVWSKYLPPERIVPKPPKDNFWGPPGTSGPCGPCTEVFFDRGETFGNPADTDDGILINGRHIEIWNAGVFMEYFKDEAGQISKLPLRCVDTGAGMERFAMILQGRDSIHEIDQYQVPFSLIKSELSDVRWSRIVFDHLKTSLMILRVGITPSNQKEGYLLKRLIRRSLTGLYLNNCDLQRANQFLAAVAESVENSELTGKHWSFINSFFNAELVAFSKMLARNSRHLEKLTSSSTLDPDTAFKLKATHGIPEELIREFCLKNSIDFPETGFADKLASHQEISRK